MFMNWTFAGTHQSPPFEPQLSEAALPARQPCTEGTVHTLGSKAGCHGRASIGRPQLQWSPLSQTTPESLHGCVGF